jgi:signal transduction histidine kinase/sensor domain CHASE-containing protein
MAIFKSLNLPFRIRRRFNLAVLTFFLGASITGSLCLLYLQNDRAERELNFQRLAGTYIDLINNSLSQDILLMRSLRAFFEANQAVQITDYQEFVTPLLKRYQGMEALEWAPRISKNNLLAFEKEANKYLFKFNVNEINAGLLKPVEARNDYFPVYFIAPANKGKGLLGLDLGSEPKILDTIERAVKTKDLAVSQRVLLNSQKEDDAKVFFITPVLKDISTPMQNDSEYPASLVGVISGVLNIKEAIQLAIAPADNQKLDYVIYEGGVIKDENILVGNISSMNNPSVKSISQYFNTTTGFSRTGKIVVAGKEWQILLMPSYRAYAFTINSLIATCIIILFGMGLTGFTILLINDKKTIILQKEILEKKNELLEEANRHRSDFLATMSHELRTPLNSILGFSDLLKKEFDGASNSKLSEYADNINSSGEHLLALVNEVLDLSKVQAGKYTLETTKFNPKKVLEGTIQSFSGAAASRGIKLITSGLDQLKDFNGDERVLRQVALNILSNSIKFTDEGGSITVLAKQENQGMEISIVDTGIGIDPSNHAMIFEEFKQVNSSLTKNFGGTGLGLAIVRRFVELHGGWVTVESSLGNGAKFTFRISEISTKKTV